MTDSDAPSVPYMEIGEVVAVVGGLASVGVTVWVDGGWCVDALLGRQSREHGDLDVAVRRDDEAAMCDWLVGRGYARRIDPIDTDDNYVLVDGVGHQIDVHVFEFDDAGDLVSGVAYPPESLTGTATLGGLTIHCIPPDWQFRFKTGYDPRPRDLADVRALADMYGFEVPPSHQ